VGKKLVYVIMYGSHIKELNGDLVELAQMLVAYQKP